MFSKDMEGAAPAILSHVKAPDLKSFSRESSYRDAISSLPPNQRYVTSSNQANMSVKKSSDKKSGEEDVLRGSVHRSDYSTMRDWNVAEDHGNDDQSSPNPDASGRRSATAVSPVGFPSLGTSCSQPCADPRSVVMAHQDYNHSTCSSSGVKRSCMSLRKLPTNPEALVDVRNHITYAASDVRSRGDVNGSGIDSSARNRQSGAENCQSVAHERETEARSGTKDYRNPGQMSASSSTWMGTAGGRLNGISGSGIVGRGSGKTRVEGRRSKPTVIEVGRNGNQNRDIDGDCRRNVEVKSNGQAAGHARLTERVNNSSSGDHDVTGSCEDRCSSDVPNSVVHENARLQQSVIELSTDDCISERANSVPESGIAICSRGRETYPQATAVRVFPRQGDRLDENKNRIKNANYIQKLSNFTQDSRAKISHQDMTSSRDYQLSTAKGHSALQDVSDIRYSSRSSSSSNSNACGSRRLEENIPQPRVSTTTAGSDHITQEAPQPLGVLPSWQPENSDAIVEEVSYRTRKSRNSASDQERKVAIDELAREAGSVEPIAQRWAQSDHRNGIVAERCSNSGSLANLMAVAPFEVSASSSDNKSRRPQGSCRSVEDSACLDGYDRTGEFHATTSATALPSKPLRRPQSVNSENANNFAISVGSEVDVLWPANPGVAIAKQHQLSNAEPANLRGLLPKAKTLVNPAKTSQNSDESAKSLTGGERARERAALDIRRSRSSESSSNPIPEACRLVKPVLDAVCASCEGRMIAQDIARDVGHPMAEFERVLEAVAPFFRCPPVVDTHLPERAMEAKETPPRVNDIKKGTRVIDCSCFPQFGPKDEVLTYRRKVADTPLRSIWAWYEEPSFYGAAVKAVDERRAHKNDAEELPFVAYFVPYLSAIQLFGYSLDIGASGSDGSVGGKQKLSARLNSHPKQSSVSEMLATLFPSPGTWDESLSQSKAVSPAVGQVSDDGINNQCSRMRLLYEFSDSELPQMRQPLFTKVEELSKGVFSPKSHSKGDSKCLEDLCLGDIHPASWYNPDPASIWFAVAWYPIYRISEGPLRTVFLTYHSFDHFTPRRTMTTLTVGTASADDVSLPVVGLECYNFQGESWLSMGGRFSKEASITARKSPVNFSECLQNRLASLQAVAAVMGREIPDVAGSAPTVGTGSRKFYHSDYEFFVKRRR